MKGGSQSQSTTVDPQTQAYVNQMRQYALGASGIGGNAGASATGPQSSINLFKNLGQGQQTPFTMPGLPPEIAQAQQQYQNYAQGGNLGFSALTGNADA